MRLALLPFVALLLVAACGSDDDGTNGGNDRPGGGSGTDGTGSQNGPGGDGTSPPIPVTSCTVPATLVVTTTPTTKVGSGNAASCTEAALRTAVTAGGVITFDCGADPVTITVTSPLKPPIDKDTVLDGDGKITISGGDRTRIVSFATNDTRNGTPTLTVQRITFTKGKSTGTGPQDGGSAINVSGASVVAIDATFVDNHGPESGQDTAGGALYNFGGGKTTVVGSRFERNSCANGGALAVLGAELTIVNSVVANNVATGTGGNPGNGGNGGAATMDGENRTLTICGSTFQGNRGGAYGGAVFRTSYHTEPSNIDQTLFADNQIPDRDPSQCGALWLQGSKATITSSSFVRNSAKTVGAISIYDHMGAPAVIDMVNVTIADNQAWPQTDFTKTGLTGGITLGGSVTGTWQNVTIAGNSAQFASGISGDTKGLTITNSIVSNVAANEYTPLNCFDSGAKGAQNLQWPANNKGNNDKECVAGIQKADPLLGALTGENVRIPGAGSPAIGLGRSCPAIDQLGKARKTDACTAGAVEVP